MRAPFSRGGAVNRVDGLVLPVGLVGVPVGGIFKGAEQVGAARLEIELGGDVAERELLLRRNRARECERAAEVERPLRAVRDSGSRALAQRNGLRRPPAELARRARVQARTDKARTLLLPVPMCVPKAFFRGNRWGAQCA